MKKFLVSLIVLCTMFFMSNAVLACDCGCERAKITKEISCTKDCDCGCQNGGECTCDKASETCAKQKCCKKCTCGFKKYFKKFKKCKKTKKECKKGCPLENIINDTDNEE